MRDFMLETNPQSEHTSKKVYEAPAINVLADSEQTEAGGGGITDAGIFS